MMRWIRLVCALALGLQAALAVAAVTGMKYISTPGDYIGGGRTATFLPPAATFTVTGTTGAVHLNVTDPNNGWFLDFAAPVNSPLARGSYADAARYPFNSPMAAGMSMSGNGRGCNTLKGWFKVLEYQLDANGNVLRAAIDFVQNCEVTGPPLYGSVRINSRFPLVVPTMAAVAGPDSTANSGATATMDGTQSFSRRGGVLGYAWSQTDGPAVTLDNPNSPTPSFVAPVIAQDAANLRFQLKVTDANGQVSTDDVVVVVIGPQAVRTEVSFHGDSGDYITGGRSYSFNTSNATLQYFRNFSGGVSASILGDSWWTFDSAAPQGQAYAVGSYPNAQRFPFQPPDAPGLSLSGDGRGCNTLTGNFTVYQAQFDSSGNPLVVEIGFEQHCEGMAPAAYGQALLNAVPHGQIARWIQAARQRWPRP